MRKFLAIFVLAILMPHASVAQGDSEDDGGFLTRTIQNALSGAGREVRITGFAGALSSEATFERMTIADDAGIWLTLEDVSLIWSRTALLRGRLMVNSLTAASLQVARLPDPVEEPAQLPSAEAEPFSLQLPDLPVSINIDAFEVSEIDLGEPILGVPARLSLRAAARLDDDGLFLDLSADRIDDVQGRLGMKANVLRDGAEITLDLRLDEAEQGIAARLMKLPDLPSVDLSIAGEGTLDDFSADIGLATAQQPRLTGQVVLSAEPGTSGDAGVNRRIRADLGGDITALIAPEYEEFFGPNVALLVNTLLVADGAIEVQDFNVSAKAIELEGKVHLNSDMWPSLVDINGQIAQDGQPVVLPGSGAGVSVRSVALDVMFDEKQGDAFKGNFDLRGVAHDAVRVDRATLEFNGELDGSVDAIGRFAGDILFDASGVDVTHQETSEALGDEITGGLRINYVEDAPVELSDIKLTGVDFGLNGDVVIQGLDDGLPTDLDVEIDAQELARFAGLIGRPIAGAAELAVAGRVVPLSSMFDLKISGAARDIAIEIPEVDRLLAGQTELSLAAARDETGTFVRGLVLRNTALDVAADVALRTAGSDVDARIELSDLGIVLPQYQGPVSLKAKAEQSEQGWRVDADLSAPYDSRALVSGLATGPEADLDFDLSVPEVRAYVPQVQGALLAKGRLWQSDEGYRIDAEASGPFGGEVDVVGVATGPDAKVDFDARLPDLAVLVPNFGGAFALSGELARAGEDWALDSQLEGPAGLTADIAGTAASDGSTVDMAATGTVPLGLAGPILAPRSIDGDASFDLSLKGAPSLEALSGTITTSNGRFSDPNLRLALQDIVSQINLANATAQLDVDAEIANGGRVAVDGSVNLTSMAGDLALGLRNAVFVDPDLYVAELDADIGVVGPLTNGARISGRIDLEEVNVTVPGTGMTTIGAIPEITHRQASNAVTTTRARAGVLPPPETEAVGDSNPPVFPIEIRIDAPSKIFVRGRGINAELGGRLDVTGTTENVISAGSFELIRGRIDIIGKRFQLTEGSVQFQGSATPYILFVTTTEIPDGTASITVEGPADRPEVTFSADPEAPEDEVISLILFGRYVSELSAFQALQLANGVSQLSGKGGVNVIGGLRDNIGLDELDVTTDEAGSTSVSAGKYITDKIYTDITNNTDRGTDISINIDLTKRLTGRAKVAEDGNSSIGLFFERDY